MIIVGYTQRTNGCGRTMQSRAMSSSRSQLPDRLDGLSEESAARLLSSRGASHTRLGGSLVWAAQATLVASLRTVNGTYPEIEPPSTLQNGIIWDNMRIYPWFGDFQPWHHGYLEGLCSFNHQEFEMIPTEKPWFFKGVAQTPTNQMEHWRMELKRCPERSWNHG